MSWDHLSADTELNQKKKEPLSISSCVTINNEFQNMPYAYMSMSRRRSSKQEE